MVDRSLIPDVEAAAHWTQHPPAILPLQTDLPLDHSLPTTNPSVKTLPHVHDTIASYEDEAPDPTTQIGAQQLRPTIEKPIHYADGWTRRLYESWTKQQELYATAESQALETLTREQENQRKLQRELLGLQNDMVENSKKTSWASWLNGIISGGFILSCFGTIFFTGLYSGVAATAVVTELAKQSFVHLQRALVVIQAGNLGFKIFTDHKGKQFAGEMQLKKYYRQKSLEKANGLMSQSNKMYEDIHRIFVQMIKEARNALRASNEMLR